MLNYILPKFSSDEYLEDLSFKDNQKDLKDLLRITEFYSEKHLERQDRWLKKSYYVDHVLGQMTLQDDLEKERNQAEETKKEGKNKKKV